MRNHLGSTAYNIPSPPIMGGADREWGPSPPLFGRTPLMAHSVWVPPQCKMNFAFPPMGERQSLTEKGCKMNLYFYPPMGDISMTDIRYIQAFPSHQSLLGGAPSHENPYPCFFPLQWGKKQGIKNGQGFA